MLTVYIIKIILFNAFTTRKDLALIFNRSLIALLIVSFLVGLKSNNLLVLSKGVSLLGGLFHNTNLSITFHLFIMFISFIIIQLTAFFPRSFINKTLDKFNKFIDNLIYNLELSNKTKEQYTIIEYPLIILFIIVGAMFLISCNDIISIFLSIELQSYGLYLLCALYRNSESSTGASLIYFLLGGLSSCFILLAFAILYGNSGTSSLSSYYLLTNLSDSRHIIPGLYLYSNSYICYSLVVLSIGFLFKISAAPFHFWSPERELGKFSTVGSKLSNSGNTLELQVPSHIRKIIGGWSNYSCMVTSLKASEKNVGNRGSKSIIYESIVVKEQRVNGS